MLLFSLGLDLKDVVESIDKDDEGDRGEEEAEVGTELVSSKEMVMKVVAEGTAAAMEEIIIEVVTDTEAMVIRATKDSGAA